MAAFDPEALREDVDLEAKRAGGRDGRGGLPQSVFASYSAFANTEGGVILLGVEEHEDGSLAVSGIERADQVVEDLWSQLNNPQKVSANLLGNASVRRHDAGSGRWVVEVEVPRASRKQRPVFVGGNPLVGTYKRLSTGDYRCTEEEVRRMFAEQVHDSRDTQRFPGYGLRHLDRTSFKGYRQLFRDTAPGHPWSEIGDEEFLLRTGCAYRDEGKGEAGLTLAGLLLFGELHWINQELPQYFLDYRELPVNDTWTEWDDRLTPDGTWSGNLYDFYMLTIRRLLRDVKVPFRLEGVRRMQETLPFRLEGVRRVQETPVHKALREALVNTIVHADYSDRVPILVIKAPDYFEFRHPGRMRVPVEQALRGGVSDCRNGTMQKMFRLIGFGEQAGSGIPRVVENWKSQHYRPPELRETQDPDATTMRLRTVSLLPDETLAGLRRQFGAAFAALDEHGRLALATAAIEGFVTNGRLRQLTGLHRHDITVLLGGLVRAEMLARDGHGRAASYRVAGAAPVDLAAGEEDVRGASSTHSGPSSTHSGPSSTHSGPSSTHSGPSSTHSGPNPDQSGASSDQSGPSPDQSGASSDQSGASPDQSDPSSHQSGASSDQSGASSDQSGPSSHPGLAAIAEAVRGRSRASRALVQETVLALCKGRFLTIQQIGTLLGRAPVGLRLRFIKPLVDQGLLERRFPQQPSHEKQAYRTRERDDG